jgi:LuxR family transcriptional regulator, maltose regulon positive regulatory protein
MPKAAAYTLSWSGVCQAYTLHDHHAELNLTLDAGSPTWHEWLEHTTSFAFRGQSGAYTARREQIKPGDWYWYAYQRSQKRVRKQYLGKSEALSLLRLEEVAARFNAGQTVEDGTPASIMSAQMRNTAREQILAAKLRVPLPPQHLVARTRLLTDLRGAIERPVTLLSAPAGSGKSTLVSSWLRQGSSPSAWLSLDQADNDPARFWPYLFTALDTLYPGVGEHALQVLRALRTPTIEHVLTLLINLLGNGEPTIREAADEALLVLDDYHIISTEAIHQGMAFLLEHLPPHLHLIISTRSDPPLPLARLRVSDRLLELRAADLRFSREEIAVFFARQAGTALSAEEIALLEERTAGWAAGLQLVALLLRDQQKHSDLLQSIRGSQHALAEYLGQEILTQLPEQVQQFLLRTSILEQLEDGLCEAVSDQPGGQETLTRFFQANLFLTPLDESHRWYRYHPIFADMLRQRLQQNAAAQIPELHRRAFRWYRAQGMLTEAVAHARAAGDWESIASLAEETGVEIISRGEAQTVMAWVAMLPRPLVYSRLRLFLFECWWHWYAGYAAVVAEMLREYIQQHALPGLEVEDVATLEQTISSHVDTLYPRTSAEQRANRIAEMLALYGVLTMQHPDGAAFSHAVCQRAVVYVAGLAHRARIAQHLGTVSILRGDLNEATAVLEDALASAIADGSATWISSIGYRLGMLYEMMGKLYDITRISQEILQLTTGKAFLTQGTAYIFLGSVEYERSHLEAAERYYKLAVASCEEADLLKAVDPYIHFLLGHLRLARIKFIRRDSIGARQCLKEIAGYLSRNWVGGEVLPVVKGEYALLMHSLGDETAGRQWLEEFPPPKQSEQMLLRQFISLNPSHHLVFMKLLLAYQCWQEAEQLAQEQQVLAEQQGRTGSLIQWLTLHALLNLAQGDSRQALSFIARALSLAEPSGYIRLFLDAGVPVLTLLYRLRHELRTQQTTAEPAPTPGYLDRLILLFKQEQQMDLTPGEDAEPSLVEPLSGREREVLWHISEGRSNREIAEQLVIAPSTVKSHVRAIYAKLGVESRTQALSQVRRSKLL